MTSNSEKKLIHAGTVGSITSVTNTVFSFLGVVLLANLLPSSELGIFFLFQAVLGLLSIPASAGINGAIEKRISQGEDGSSILGTALLMKAIILIILSISIIQFNSLFNSYIGKDLIHLLIIGLFVQECSTVAQRLLKAEKRIATAHILEASRSVFWTTTGVIFAFIGLGVEKIIYAFLGGYFIVASIGTLIKQTEIGSITRGDFRSIMKYAKYNAVTTVGGTVYGRMDTAMLGFFVSPSLIAAYEIAWRISKIGLTISRVVAVTTFPQISEWSKGEKYDQISKTISESLVASLLIVIPAFFGAFLFSSEILTLIYGPEYAVAGGVFVILALERVIKAATQVFSRCLHAMDHPDLSARAAILAICVNLVLNWILIQQFGIMGAAIATSVSFGLKSVFEFMYLRDIIVVRVPFKPIASIFAASISMILIVYPLKELFYPENLITLVGLIIIGATCYFGVLFISPSMRNRALIVISQMRPTN